jgi:hypothetical protein
MGQLELNPTYPFSEIEIDRQWKVHTCFESCKDPNSEDLAFTQDERPICGEIIDGKEYKLDDGILCLEPQKNDCEIYVSTS